MGDLTMTTTSVVLATASAGGVAVPSSSNDWWCWCNGVEFDHDSPDDDEALLTFELADGEDLVCWQCKYASKVVAPTNFMLGCGWSVKNVFTVALRPCEWGA